MQLEDPNSEYEIKHNPKYPINKILCPSNIYLN